MKWTTTSQEILKENNALLLRSAGSWGKITAGDVAKAKKILWITNEISANTWLKLTLHHQCDTTDGQTQGLALVQ